MAAKAFKPAVGLFRHRGASMLSHLAWPAHLIMLLGTPAKQLAAMERLRADWQASREADRLKTGDIVLERIVIVKRHPFQTVPIAEIVSLACRSEGIPDEVIIDPIAKCIHKAFSGWGQTKIVEAVCGR